LTGAVSLHPLTRGTQKDQSGCSPPALRAVPFTECLCVWPHEIGDHVPDRHNSDSCSIEILFALCDRLRAAVITCLRHTPEAGRAGGATVDLTGGTWRNWVFGFRHLSSHLEPGAGPARRSPNLECGKRCWFSHAYTARSPSTYLLSQAVKSRSVMDMHDIKRESRSGCPTAARGGQPCFHNQHHTQPWG
jgi:hypothetical protein